MATEYYTTLITSRTVKIEIHCDSSTDGDSILDHGNLNPSSSSSLGGSMEFQQHEGSEELNQKEPSITDMIAGLDTSTSSSLLAELIPPQSMQDEIAKEAAKTKEVPHRRSSLLSRLGTGLKLSNEQVDIADAGLRSQLSRLNKLMKLDTSKPKLRKRFLEQMTELLIKNPTLALCRFKIDGYEEPLLHQVICKKPSLELVSLVYAFNPRAALEKGFGDYTILHHACLCHNEKQVIEFLIQQEPQNLQARPFPPLFCAIDKETNFDVLELLVKSYPDALCSCDVASITPLDIALMEQLSAPVIQLLYSNFPGTELKVSHQAGMVPMHPDISSIFASDHDVIRKLDATNMRFTQHSLVIFFQRMTRNTTLTEILLDLGDAEVDPDVCEALEQLLRENCSIKRLTISGRILPTAFANAVINGFRQNQAINELTFLVHLDSLNVEGLIRNCAEHESLTKLTLRHCVAESADWSGLSELKSIESLDLSECKIGPALAAPIATLLETTDTLKELSIARNHVGNNGTLLIAEALRKNSSLVSLDFGQNDIKESGWQALIATLQEHNTKLRSIGSAIEDEFYEVYNEQVLYYCDQNALGRNLSPKTYAEDTVKDKL